MSFDTSDPKAPEGATVLLHHGTSEGHLAGLLQNGFAAGGQSPRDFLRGIIADHLPGQEVGDALVDAVRARHSRINWRSDESNSGGTLFAAGDRDVAAKYAAYNAEHGGELGKDIHTALRQSGFADVPPRFAGARPVLLSLEVPAEDLHLQKGLGLHAGPDGKLRAETPHEVFVNDTRRAVITGVTFARMQDGAWTFDGQSEMSPAAALAEIAPAFAARGKAAPAAAADADARHIAQTIYGFRQDADVKTEHVHFRPVAVASVYLPDGSLGKLRVPDPHFEPATKNFGPAYGFDGLSTEYKLPGSLGGGDIDAYLNVLEARSQHGTLSPEERNAAEKKLFTRLCADNPPLAAAGIDAARPDEVRAALRGVAHGLTPADISFAAKNPAADRDASYLEARKAAGFFGGWNAAPDTLKVFQTQMDKKLAAFAPGPKAPAP